jgi:hypothetical protein
LRALSLPLFSTEKCQDDKGDERHQRSSSSFKHAPGAPNARSVSHSSSLFPRETGLEKPGSILLARKLLPEILPCSSQAIAACRWRKRRGEPSVKCGVFCGNGAFIWGGTSLSSRRETAHSCPCTRAADAFPGIPGGSYRACFPLASQSLPRCFPLSSLISIYSIRYAICMKQQGTCEACAHTTADVCAPK